MKVALLQLMPGQTLEAQKQIGFDACARARAMGADIALFPEMWSNGYRVPDNAEALRAQAIPADGPFVRDFGALARELDMAICITYLERHPTGPRNSATLFDRHGEALFTYAKVHTCDFEGERHLARGDDFYAADLDTAAGPVRVGCMICYDREFPESARILMLKGTEVILVPNACPMEINRLAQLRTRAFENMLGIATCTYPAGKPDCNGRSTAFDGIACLPELPDWRDTCILEADASPGIYLADFDLDTLRRYRATEIHGNAYRRPDRYGLLTRDVRQAPFLRADYRPADVD